MKSKKVRCIDDSIKADQILLVSRVYQEWVKKDMVYTVREVLDNDGIVTGLLLNEIVNDPIPQELLGGRWQEPAFRVSRFVEEECVEEENYLYLCESNY
jgi:hypothetical protein